LDEYFLSEFGIGKGFEKTGVQEEKKLPKQQITQLQSKLHTLSVTFEQETGREAVI